MGRHSHECLPIFLIRSILHLETNVDSAWPVDYHSTLLVKVPKRILELVMAKRIAFSGKAQWQLATGFFDFDDLINSILNGAVTKKERDEKKQAKYKYTIIGPSLSGQPLYSCGKIIGKTQKVYLVITFHKAR